MCVSFSTFLFFILFLLCISPSPKSHFHLCKPLVFVLAIQTGSNAAAKQQFTQNSSLPKECAESHISLGRGAQGAHTWLHHAKLTSLGVRKALSGLHIQGCKGLLHFAEPLSTDCSWILGPIFSDAFKAGTNNSELKVRSSHWFSPSHLKFHVLPPLCASEI